MNVRNLLILIAGFLAGMVPARASMSFHIGDTFNNSLATAINAWNSETGLAYLLQDTTFTGTVSASSPKTYTDSLSGALFAGFNLSGGVNKTTDDLAVSSSELQQTATGGIIEITNFPTNVFAFAAEFSLVQLASPNGFCFEVNHPSFNQGTFCDDSFAMINLSDIVFVGVKSSTPITSIWIGPLGSQSEKIQINNFEIPPAGTPEVSTTALLGTGLILLFGIGRWRKAAERSE